MNVKCGGDMFLLHQWIKNEPVDLLIGNTYGKYIARDEDIPLVRYGFPILDRIGHSYFPTVGYRGGLRLLEKILDALLDRQDRDATISTWNWSCKSGDGRQKYKVKEDELRTADICPPASVNGKQEKNHDFHTDPKRTQPRFIARAASRLT